jgi:hypothetical protein
MRLSLRMQTTAALPEGASAQQAFRGSNPDNWSQPRQAHSRHFAVNCSVAFPSRILMT